MSELPPSAPFMRLPDDIVLNIFSKLSDDPRNWARLACVSTRISTLIRQVCWKSSCLKLLPSVSADLSNTSFSSLSSSSSTAVTDSATPPGGWASLYKIAVCCPGLLHSGVLLEHSDFGLELDLGPDHLFYDPNSSAADAAIADAAAAEAAAACASYAALHPSQLVASSSTCTWSLYDDLYYDTVYDNSDSPTANMELDDLIAHHHQQLQQQEEQRQQQQQQQQQQEQGTAALANPSETAEDKEDDEDDNDDDDGEDISNGNSNPGMKKKKRKVTRPLCSHLASGAWNLSREHGSKLLASRFRGDTLYICDWPGCVHMEEKRNYMLFRGIFKDFKRSRVWRTINDGHKGKIAVKCAFCDCKDTWDLHSGFCLKRGFGYHDDGEPVVRAYVCDNGHVSGAWTDWPLYN